MVAIVDKRSGVPSPNRRYPWERWFSKRKFTLVKGRHYECQPHSMAQQVRSAASKYGCRVSIKLEGETITATMVKQLVQEN